MNNLAITLYKQAMEFAYQVCKEQGRSGGAEDHIWNAIVAAKLSELIVQECVNLCEGNGETYKYSFTPAKAKLAETTSKHCGELIKRRFQI